METEETTNQDSRSRMRVLIEFTESGGVVMQIGDGVTAYNLHGAAGILAFQANMSMTQATMQQPEQGIAVARGMPTGMPRRPRGN